MESFVYQVTILVVLGNGPGWLRQCPYACKLRSEIRDCSSVLECRTISGIFTQAAQSLCKGLVPHIPTPHCFKETFLPFFDHFLTDIKMIFDWHVNKKAQNGPPKCNKEQEYKLLSPHYWAFLQFVICHLSNPSRILLVLTFNGRNQQNANAGRILLGFGRKLWIT